MAKRSKRHPRAGVRIETTIPAMKPDAARARLLQLMADRSTDLATVSKAIGRNHAYLQQFVKRGTPRHLPEDAREALERHFGVSADDFRNTPRRTVDHSQITLVPSSSVRFDELDVRAGAGPGQLTENKGKIGEWQIPRELVKVATNSPFERIKIVTVVGDSMMPTYNPIDRVMVDTGNCSPSPPGVFVVWDGFGLVIKRLQIIPRSEPPRVKMTSDNSKYDAYECVLGDAYIQGRVIGKWLWS